MHYRGNSQQRWGLGAESSWSPNSWWKEAKHHHGDLPRDARGEAVISPAACKIIQCPCSDYNFCLFIVGCRWSPWLFGGPMLGSFHSFSLKLFSILTLVRTGCKIRHTTSKETFLNFLQASHKVIRAVQFRWCQQQCLLQRGAVSQAKRAYRGVKFFPSYETRAKCQLLALMALVTATDVLSPLACASVSLCLGTAKVAVQEL